MQLQVGKTCDKNCHLIRDAVLTTTGRLYERGFLPLHPAPLYNHDTMPEIAYPIGAKTYLATHFREAPKYMHDRGHPRSYKNPIDWTDQSGYWADRNLRPDQQLPDSDLLKALHVYASEFYARSPTQGQIDFSSMDGSALLALGILVEEAVREELGKDGDLVFVEGDGGEGDVAMMTKGSRLCDQSDADGLRKGSRAGHGWERRKRRKIGGMGFGEF